MDKNDQILLELGELKGLVRAGNDMQVALGKRLDGHDVRVRSLESWRSWALGVGAAISAGISFVVGRA